MASIDEILRSLAPGDGAPRRAPPAPPRSARRRIGEWFKGVLDARLWEARLDARDALHALADGVHRVSDRLMIFGYWLSGLGDRAVAIDDLVIEPEAPEPPDILASPPPPSGFVLEQAPALPALLALPAPPPPGSWEWCNRIADSCTAARIASFHDLEYEQVWWALRRLPPEDVSLLDLPSGQVRVACWVASALGAPASQPFQPAIH